VPFGFTGSDAGFARETSGFASGNDAGRRTATTDAGRGTGFGTGAGN